MTDEDLRKLIEEYRRRNFTYLGTLVPELTDRILKLEKQVRVLAKIHELKEIK